VLTPKMEARILDKSRRPPPDGSTHRSSRKLGRVVQIHHKLIAKAWQRAGLQPVGSGTGAVIRSAAPWL
jgi:hypothetical protein